MRFFVTGATGFIGSALVRKLREANHIVHALFRSKYKTASIKHPNVRLIKGDILNPISLHKAMEGCLYVFHTAAITKMWTKSPRLYYDINVTGTKNVMEAALNLGIKKVVLTSTAGVFGPSINHEVNENTIRKTKYFTKYEKSKAEADSLALDYVKKGINVVIVHPTRIYGPGPFRESNSITKIMKLYIKGRWPFLPGKGNKIGNYVYIDDVINGHILAMEKGHSGEKYILCGENTSYRYFFNYLKKISQKNYFLIRLPFFTIISFSQITKNLAKIFNQYPLITPEMAKKLNQNWSVSCGKAKKELGYRPTSLEKGIRKTIDWVKMEVK